MSNLSRLAVVLGAAALALPLAIPASAKGPGASKVISMVDTDNDGTIDLKEAQAVAGALLRQAGIRQGRHRRRQGAPGPRQQEGAQGRRPGFGRHPRQDRVPRPRRGPLQGRRSGQRRHPRRQGAEDPRRQGAGLPSQVRPAGASGTGPRPTSRDGPALPAPGRSRFRAWESSRSDSRQGLTGGGSSEHSRLACHSRPCRLPMAAPSKRRPVHGILRPAVHQRPDARVDLRPDRPRLHHGLRHHRHGELRPWRRLHALVLHRADLLPHPHDLARAHLGRPGLPHRAGPRHGRSPPCGAGRSSGSPTGPCAARSASRR